MIRRLEIYGARSMKCSEKSNFKLRLLFNQG